MGLGAAEALAAAGARVAILTDIDAAGVRSALGLRASRRLRHRWRRRVGRGDVTAIVDAVTAHFGRLDILVNNAGVLHPTRFLDIGAAEWQRTIAVNLTGTFLCSQAAAVAMRARGYGRIVNVSSSAGRSVSTLGGAHYTASKAGVLGLHREPRRRSWRHMASPSTQYVRGSLTPTWCACARRRRSATAMHDRSLSPDWGRSRRSPRLSAFSPRRMRDTSRAPRSILQWWRPHDVRPERWAARRTRCASLLAGVAARSMVCVPVSNTLVLFVSIYRSESSLVHRDRPDGIAQFRRRCAARRVKVALCRWAKQVTEFLQRTRQRFAAVQ